MSYTSLCVFLSVSFSLSHLSILSKFFLQSLRLTYSLPGPLKIILNDGHYTVLPRCLRPFPQQ